MGNWKDFREVSDRQYGLHFKSGSLCGRTQAGRAVRNAWVSRRGELMTAMGNGEAWVEWRVLVQLTWQEYN